jgi:hypothetical protein
MLTNIVQKVPRAVLRWTIRGHLSHREFYRISRRLNIIRPPWMLMLGAFVRLQRVGSRNEVYNH